MFLKKNNNKIGLVLCGGGARGFFHIGVIKALQDLNIRISEISGVSIGAVIGALYASNPEMNFDNVLESFYDFGIEYFFKKKDKTYRKRVMSSVESFLKENIKQRKIEDLKIKFSFIAVDIENFNIVEYRRGRIFPNLMASIAIPFIFGPIKINGKLLVDGGVIKTGSVSSIKGCDKIIVSDISVCLSERIKKNTMFNAIDLSIGVPERYNFLNDVKNAKKNGKRILSIENNSDSQTFDFSKKSIKKSINCGYENVMANKRKVLNLIKK